MDKIPVTRSSLAPYEEYIAEIKDIWTSHHLTNMGQKHERLETMLKDFLKANHLTLFTNGHLALEATIASLDLTGEVITTPFTFASTTHAIVRNGCIPVFCDIDSDTYTMDVSKIEELITENTSAIIPVHVYGSVCDIEGIQKIADKYNLKVIYDAAHAFGVTVDGKGVGEFGDASMFSFHATKVFHTIEGGGVTYNNSKLSSKLDNMKNFGITGPETVEAIGANAKMNEFQAAMGIVNLPNFEKDREKRKKCAFTYTEELSSIPGLKLMSHQESVEANYAYYPVVFEGELWDRNKVAEALTEQNVFVRKYFYPLVSDFDCYKHSYSSSQTPIAKDIASNVLTLPLYADLSIEEVKHICQLIKSLSPYKGRKKQTQSLTKAPKSVMKGV